MSRNYSARLSLVVVYVAPREGRVSRNVSLRQPLGTDQPSRPARVV